MVLLWLVLPNSFLSDDWGLISSSRTFSDVFTTRYPGPFYRPLVRLSFYLTGLVSGSPLLFSVCNVLLHALASCVVFLLARELITRKSGLVAWMASLMFLALPIHSDNVFWVSARFDTMCTIFALMTILFYMRFLSRPTAPNLGLTLVLFWAALLSKEMALSLPAILLILTLYRRKLLERTAWYVLFPVLLSFGLFLLIRSQITGAFLFSPSTASLSVTRVIRSLAVATGSVFRTNTYAVGIAVMSATLVFVVLLYRNRDLRRDCCLFLVLFLISLVPLLGHVTRWYLYLPSAFCCLALARVWIGPSLRGPQRKLSIGFLSLLLVYYGATLINEGLLWRETSRISQRTLASLATRIMDDTSEFYLINVPSAYSPSGAVGEKPLFAYNLPLALSRTSDGNVQPDLVIVNHLWLYEDRPGISSSQRLDDSTLVLQCDDGGFFSFHTQEFVFSRRDKRGEILERPWGRLNIVTPQSMILEIHPSKDGKFLFYDGSQWLRIQ